MLLEQFIHFQGMQVLLEAIKNLVPKRRLPVEIPFFLQ